MTNTRNTKEKRTYGACASRAKKFRPFGFEATFFASLCMLRPCPSSVVFFHGWKSHLWMTYTDNTFIHG